MTQWKFPAALIAVFLMGSPALGAEPTEDEKVFLAARNLPNVGICDVASMDPVVLIRFEKVLVTLPALKLIEERLS